MPKFSWRRDLEAHRNSWPSPRVFRYHRGLVIAPRPKIHGLACCWWGVRIKSAGPPTSQ
jgi:hypothetical protein